MPNPGSICIIPGFAGSKLFSRPFPFDLAKGLLVWLNYPLISGGGWALMGLEPDGVTPTSPFTGPLVAGYPVSYYYGVISDKFQSLGWNVFSPVMDWRQEISLDGARIADFLRSVSYLAPINIVCHSRGGLAFRYALDLLNKSGQLGIIGKVAGCGVPHYGTWEAEALLAGWNRFVLLLQGLAWAVPFIDIPGWLATNLQKVLNSWPSCYNLLPSPNAPGLNPGIVAQLYNSAAWENQGMTVSQAWLSASVTSWNSIPAVPPSVQWLDVVGLGLPTAWASATGFLPGKHTDLTYIDGGDGTVPEQWAVQPGRLRLTTPTSHRALVYDGRIIHWLDQWFRGLNGGAGVILGDLLE